MLEFLKGQRLAVLASVSEAGGPHAAMIGIAVTDQFELLFDTLETTRKARDLLRDPRVAMVIGGWSPGAERTVQYEGIVDEPRGEELERLRAVAYRAYPDGRALASGRRVILLRARPTWIWYSDFTLDPVEVVEFSQAALTVTLES